MLHNLLEYGFAGPIYPVNPKAREVEGLRAYPRVGDVPGPVELAVIAVPGPRVLDVARECAAHDVRGIIVISAGFGETGEEGRERQRELLEGTRRSDNSKVTEIRVKRLWKKAAAAGVTEDGFQAWLGDVLGESKAAEDITLADVAKLEDEVINLCKRAGGRRK